MEFEVDFFTLKARKTLIESRLFGCASILLHLYGGEGVDMYQGVEFPKICPWQDEFDPNCPTELLANIGEVEEYEFNYAAIKKWLPWVTIV